MHQTTLNHLKHFSLLVVEDDEIALLMLKQALKPYVEALYVAKDGFEGLELFKKYRVDMIVTDIHLPGINGFEMIKEIQALKPEQLFVVMTSFDTDQNIIHSMHEGACSFLRKPIDIKELQTTLLMVSSRITEKRTRLSDAITIDSNKELILKNDSPLFLSQTHHKIFWLLCYNLERLVTYEMVEDYVYFGESVSKSTLHVAIMRIKQHLPGVVIENVVNMGYSLKLPR